MLFQIAMSSSASRSCLTLSGLAFHGSCICHVIHPIKPSTVPPAIIHTGFIFDRYAITALADVNSALLRLVSTSLTSRMLLATNRPTVIGARPRFTAPTHGEARRRSIHPLTHHATTDDGTHLAKSETSAPGIPAACSPTSTTAI